MLNRKKLTKEKNTFEQEKVLKPEQDKAWDLTHTIVRRHYTDDDVKKARYLQNKFDNVDTIASLIVAFILVIWARSKVVMIMIDQL